MLRKFIAFLFIVIAPSGLWVAAQPPAHVVIMHTNDIHGQLLPRDGLGGIAEMATIIRNANPDLILDAGDLFTGTFLSDELRGEPTIQAMNSIGYTAGTIGNHEFDYGQKALRLRLREAKFPVLSANLQSPIAEVKKYTVVTVKGIRFGIVGLTTEDTAIKSHPKNMNGVELKDIVKSLQRIMPEVRRKSDFVIATVHLEDAEERRLAAAFPEIRLIIGGHTHATVTPVWLGQTLVVKTGVSGHNVGRVDLEFEGKKLAHIDNALIPVRNVPADPQVAKLLAPFVSRLDQKVTEIVGEATVELTRSKKVESSVANLVADSFREKAKTQIGIENTGGIRADIAKGTLTWGSVFEVLPFENTLVTLKLTGAQLKKTLLTGLNPVVGLTAVSGLRVQFDPKKTGDQRIVTLTLSDGSLIEDTKLYTVATNDFVAAGGDGYTEFAKGKNIVDTGILLRDVLVDYIKARRVLTPAVDGRITLD